MKDKSPVYHLFSNGGCLLGGCLYKGEGWKLKSTCSTISHLFFFACTKLSFFWQDVENSKYPHSVMEPSKNFALYLAEFITTPLNLLKITDQWCIIDLLSFDLSEIGRFWSCLHCWLAIDQGLWERKHLCQVPYKLR